MFSYYQDPFCYYFWKPAGIPSSFGKEKSFLDYLLEQKQHNESLADIVQSLYAFFGKEKEIWLLNRLDNETSGLLYFAKNPRVYKEFKQQQSDFQLKKYYLAEVYGDICTFCKETYGQEKGVIKKEIAHHKFNTDRMVVINSPSDIQKIKWIPHQLSTEIIEIQFFPTTRTSVLLLCIQKGFRHQIRAHLSSIGFPICGDRLYSKSNHKDYPTLQLFSVGVETI